jgi:hypothetical protein
LQTGSPLVFLRQRVVMMVVVVVEVEVVVVEVVVVAEVVEVEEEDGVAGWVEVALCDAGAW